MDAVADPAAPADPTKDTYIASWCGESNCNSAGFTRGDPPLAGAVTDVLRPAHDAERRGEPGVDVRNGDVEDRPGLPLADAAVLGQPQHQERVLVEDLAPVARVDDDVAAVTAERADLLAGAGAQQ
jgi:hypothetical protein